MQEKNLTPMLRQYFAIKKEYPDAILFFRMGDFYEMFFEDARKAAPILEVVLTSRDKNKEDAVPMCGVPYHAYENYAARLLRQGLRVAICEQVEDPAKARGLVKREVTRVLTPATALEIEGGEIPLNSFVVSVVQDADGYALASVDLAAGEFEVHYVRADRLENLVNEFYKKMPREVVISGSLRPQLEKFLESMPDTTDMLINETDDFDMNLAENEERIKEQLKIETLEGLGLSGFDAAIIASGVLIKYLTTVRKTAVSNLSSLRFIPEEDHLVLDPTSLRNLEILTNLRSGGVRGSLFATVDYTLTTMGRRLLKKWLSYPLLDITAINQRLDGVAECNENLISRTEIRKWLKRFGDLSKLNAKVSLGVANPLHLLALRDTLEKIPAVKSELEPMRSTLLTMIREELNPLRELVDLVGKAIADDPGNSISEGNVIRSGYNRDLDELRDISRNAKKIISAMEKTERDSTGINKLKIKYNKVFGYFIEVTKSHLKSVPDHYVRKQTLVNAERFITAELKELEDKILRAEEKIIQIERDLFSRLIERIRTFSPQLNRNAELIALLDVVSAGAELAQRRDFNRPELNEGNEIEITGGRHPVVEAGSDKGFIPNDTRLTRNDEQILIITGPNMGGKSTYLRQNALIVLLAQAGYFVPAERARVGTCDRIFTRIGASDALIEGKSTFLIEMIETSIILNNVTDRSLVLLDEIGRGTSTFDGLSIAWAVVEFLHDLPARPKTLFATHYHELTELGELLERVRNYHITVREWQDNVVFLHKIIPGATDQSFGIHVARISGIPPAVIERAKDVLLNLEKKELNRLVKERITGKIQSLPKEQGNLFADEREFKLWDEIREKLKEIEISTLTPLEALNILHYLKHKSDSFD